MYIDKKTDLELLLSECLFKIKVCTNKESSVPILECSTNQIDIIFQASTFVIMFGLLFIFLENHLDGRAIVCQGGDQYAR